MKKVAIIDSSYAYEKLFSDNGWGFSTVQEADLVCFTGGEDVTPDLYGHEKHQTTFNNLSRDLIELDIFTHIPSTTPVVGICRGAQFLNVVCGGEMYQDVGGHTRSHWIKDSTTGEEVFCTSTHHQMMKPSSEAVLVASSTIGGARLYWDGEKFVTEKSEVDNEVVFYKEDKVLCFQPHPEMCTGDERFNRMRSYFFECVNKYLGV
jgi:GMP synthase-like glutamine amidotransferase